jgi:hypothetical protein
MTADGKPEPTITEAALAEMVRTALRMASPPTSLKLVVWRRNNYKPNPETYRLWAGDGPRSSADVKPEPLYRDSERLAFLATFRIADIALWFHDKRPGVLGEPVALSHHRRAGVAAVAAE